MILVVEQKGGQTRRIVLYGTKVRYHFHVKQEGGIVFFGTVHKGGVFDEQATCTRMV